MDLLADTTFLIDLWRESSPSGAAVRYARANLKKQVGLCWVVQAEFISGAVIAGHDAEPVARFLSRYTTVHSTDAIIRHYADIYADLRSRNQLIGPNDLWIAASARALGLPLLVRNVQEFERVEGLELIAYAQNQQDQ